MQPRNLVDYVTGIPVNDPFDVLARIVNAAVPELADQLKPRLELVKGWLKYRHASKAIIDDSDQCLRHDTTLGLTLQLDEAKAVTCEACFGFHKFFSFSRRKVSSSGIHPNAALTIDDIAEKAHLYMGHTLGVVNWQCAIALSARDILTECRSATAHGTAVILIYFKMKAEPLYFREKQTDHSDKRGMTWHGVLVQFE